MSNYLAVDIGGTHTRIALFPENEHAAITSKRISTQKGDKPILERLIDLIDSFLPKNDYVHGIGVAAPSPVDPYNGIVIDAPNIPGWDNLPLKKILEDRFGVPVKLGNDANLAALGEWRFGAGRGHHHIIYITVSTGIGGGIIVDDKLLLGVGGLAAELGHVTVLPDGPVCSCGLRGHLEALASGPAITRWVMNEINEGTRSILSVSDSLSAKDIAEAARNNDKLAKKSFKRAGMYIGIALVNFLHIFNPSMIIFGGGVSQSGSLLLNPVKEELKKRILSKTYLDDLSVIISPLGDDVGLMGALALIQSDQE